MEQSEQSVCAAIAMAAVEHSPLCQEDNLCRQVGRITRDAIPRLYSLNRTDFYLEILALFALLLCYFKEKLGGARTGGLLLLFLLALDLTLQMMSIETTGGILPTVRVLKDSNCLNQLQGEGRAAQETLVKLENDLDTVIGLGYAELISGALAAIGDLKDMYDESRGRGMDPIQRSIFLFLPAVADVLLAALDFFVYTSSARDESVDLRQSLIQRSNRWCVRVTDDCAPIAEEDAVRRGGAPPAEAAYEAFTISVLIAAPVVVVLYILCAVVLHRRKKAASKAKGSTHIKLPLPLSKQSSQDAPKSGPSKEGLPSQSRSEQLRQELAKERAENERLREELGKERAENERLRKQIEVAKKGAENERLRKERLRKDNVRVSPAPIHHV